MSRRQILLFAVLLLANGTVIIAATGSSPSQDAPLEEMAARRAAPAEARTFAFVDPIAPELEAYGEILERPLFFASRRPSDQAALEEPAPLAEEVPLPPEPPPLRFRAVGTLIGDATSMALIRSLEDRKEQWLAINDVHRGWALSAITTTHVEVRAAGIVRRLPVHDDRER